ncbi:FtsX-like permease family protein [Reichenbachiella sp. MALMAid0571]|uniref:ABC transporter permease n=1 Tax=Reichenbachiella sp. MALMAid0571 TaxID=3143939 RepID=UPI0032E026A9
MIRNYLFVGIRNLQKNLSYVIINTFGLGIAMACCITAYLLIAYNIEFDNFHKSSKVDLIYKVHSHYNKTEGDPYQQISAPINLAPNAAMEISGIKRYTRYMNEGGFVKSGDDSYSERIAFADSTFFEMFDFPLVNGSYGSFKNMHTIFLSKKTAVKYFKDENPIGKVLEINFPNQTEVQVTVGGVVDKVPQNSSFVFDMLVRFEHFYDIYDLNSDNWKDWRDPSTFFELTAHNQAPYISEQFNKYIERRNKEKTDRVVKSYQLQQFKTYYDREQVQWSQINLPMSITPMVVFISMALIILMIACFNMTNTSIAMTAQRMKEVGIRKVVGATKWQIISQFLFETLLVILLSLVAGLFMSNIITPAFTDMWNLNYGMEDLNGLNLIIALLIIIFFTSLIAGIYPALSSSRFVPVLLLKGNLKIKGSTLLSKSLITIQFALSVIVLIAGVMFVQNTKYQEKVKFGYDKDMVYMIKVSGEKEFEVMENDLRSNPKILKIGGTAHSLGWDSYAVPLGVDTAKYEARHYGVGKNYFDIMGMKVLNGRVFSTESTNDLNSAVVVNQAFLKKIGIEDDPLMKTIVIHEVKRHIVGVVDNHIDNLFRSREPEASVFYPALPNQYQYLLVRAEPENLTSLEDYIEDLWKKNIPDKPFQGWFQEDILFEDLRETNANLKKIFLFLTVLGGLLSASGIFSLATLDVKKRSKEIGVRKVLGASVSNILALMNKEFLIILSIAGIIGSLGGYFLTGALLDEIYAYHIPIGIIPILICTATIICVGLSTTCMTILKAAKSNPVDTLRDE